VFVLAPYVVGPNPNSPANPHSALASGGNDTENIDTSLQQVAYAVALGGPDEPDQFYEIRSDWPETEVALDYYVPMLTLVAMHVLNDTSDPFFTRPQAGDFAARKPSGKPCDDAIPCHSGLSTGAKVALGVVLSIVGSAIIAAGTWYYCRLKRRHRY